MRIGKALKNSQLRADSFKELFLCDLGVLGR